MHNCQSIVTYNLHLCTYLFLYSFIYSLIHLFLYSFIYFCIHSFIYSFIHSCISSSQYVNEMCQSKIGRRYLTHHWLIVFNALYSIRLALPCCHGKRAIDRSRNSSLERPSSNHTLATATKRRRSDNFEVWAAWWSSVLTGLLDLTQRLEGCVFFPHFQSPKHKRKGAGGGLNSVGDPTPTSIYRKTHICLLQSKWSCLQIAIYLSSELRYR